MTPQASGLLTKTALAALIEQADSLTNNGIDHEQLECLVDAPASEFVVRGREFATTGLPGLYTGEIRRPYDKHPIESLLPTPLYVKLDAPFTFAALRAYVRDQYGIRLEENEFTQASDPVSGLFDSTLILGPTDITLGVFTLTTTINSGRFLPGGSLRIRCGRRGGNQFLAEYLRQTRVPDMAELKQAANSAGVKSLFGATPLDVSLELLQRHNGFPVNPTDLEVTPVVKDHSTTKVSVAPRVASLSKYIGTSEFLYKKANLQSLCPDVLRVNLQFPVTFQVLVTVISQIYGLILEAGEFSLRTFDGPVLQLDTQITGDLLSDAMLELYVQPSSRKWLGRERLLIQFVSPYNESGQVRITSSAPLGMEGVTYTYQVVAEGGQGPYTYETVSGTPPCPFNAATGVYSGDIEEGEYTWVVKVKDARGRIALRREVIAVGKGGLDFPAYMANISTIYVSSADPTKAYMPSDFVPPEE